MLTRILSHNVYWFQGHPFKGDQPPGPNIDVIAALASLYQSLAPNLLCLQEIQSLQTASLLSDRLHIPAFYTPGRQLPQYGGASLSANAQIVGDSTSSTPAPQRIWQTLKIPFADTHLTIANIHLPSARQLPGAQAAAQRIIELQSILTLHPDTHILLGDFNESAFGGVPGPVSDFLTSQGFLDAAVTVPSADLPTNVTGVKNRRGDQIWLKNTLAPALVGYGVVTEPDMRTTLPDITHLSDHFPLWIDLKANP
jgi:endonuclease/exonuclease/phosphatase (EEP) superfamily protein YafD